MPANRIPEEEYRTRITRIMAALIPKGTGTQPELKELFRLYNDRLSPYESESGTVCGGCTTRVFKRMKQYYEESWKQNT